ncbi:hypothetical protein BH23ACT5_BH23ACT5_21190 [soil metagenome]
MQTFTGTLELTDQTGESLQVRVTVMGGNLGLAADSGGLGSWSLTEMEFARTVEEFTFTVDGDTFRLVVDDPDGFWSAIGTTNDGPFAPRASERAPVPQWWRFWSVESWRSWWARRGSWTEHRKLVRSLDRGIAEATSSQRANETALEQARKHLAWARDVRDRDVPIRTARSEVGLAVVPGVTLLETRKRDGNEVWTAVDSGSVYFTDRKMVFSGRKDVQFPFDKTTVSEHRNEGLHVVVSSRKRDHVLSGPAEQLLVVLKASQAAGQGESPTASLEATIASLADSMAAIATEREEMKTRRAGLIAPQRPLSPAWLPVAALVFLVGALGAGADDRGFPDITAAPSTTTPAPATTTITTPPAMASPTTATPTSLSSPSPRPTAEPDVTTTTGDALTAGGGTETPDELVVYFFDVGQGDATLLAGPDFTILIDAGRHDRSDVVSHLQRSGVEAIDLLVGTHPHADHIGQIPDVLAAFPVTEVWMSGDSHTTQIFERTLDAIADSDAGYHEPRAGESLSIGSALVEVVNPTSPTGDPA